MSIPELLIQGLQLMLMGMGFVFVFLGLLVAAVTLTSRKFAGNGSTQAAVAAPLAESPTGGDLMADPELVSVITAAVHNYRNQKNS